MAWGSALGRGFWILDYSKNSFAAGQLGDWPLVLPKGATRR
jgi:hypothetical protein